MKRSTALCSVLSAALVAIACGGSQPEPETAPPAAPPAPPAEAASQPSPPSAPPAEAPPAASATPAEPAWKDMTVDQRKETMKVVVLPQMKTVFQELDPKMFADVTCKTCHGDSAKDGTFKMPNPKLPKLDPANGFAKHMKKNAKVTKFMMERVAPGMANLLKVAPYDPDTHEGFGCFNCHTMAVK